MARPRKAIEAKRTTQRNLRFTLEEDTLLRIQAREARMNVSDYIRTLALSHRVRPTVSRKADPGLISELNRIGVNVNQLARATHRGGEFTRYWEDIGTELQTILAQVIEQDDS